MHHHSSSAVSGELTKPPTTPPSPAPLQPLLDLITNVLSLLLISSLTVRSFIGRWQILRSKLFSLNTSLSSLSESPHWSQNPLLHTLLPHLLSNLQRLHSLSHQCSSESFSGGKLLMQSDLDIASSSLSNHINDLNLLLRSGVLHQNAIVLSHRNDDISLFIKDLFTRLQIGDGEFKIKSLESLLNLLDCEKSARMVAKEGNIGYLLTLLDLHHSHNNNDHALIREHALAVVSLLVSSSVDSRKIVFAQGGLGPLLRLLEPQSPPSLKTRAATAIEAITSDLESAWVVSAYGGVTVLIEACRSGTSQVQEHVVGAMSNIAEVEDIRTMLVEEGAVPVVIPLVYTYEKAARFVSLVACSGEYFRDLIVREKGLQILIRVVQDSDSSNLELVEHALFALSELSAMDSVAKALSTSTRFIIQLGEFVKLYGKNVMVQQNSASLLTKLSISDGNKRAVADCLGSLIRLMELSKPAGVQDVAAEAVKSLLTVRSNRKELIRDEKSLVRLVQMLDPRNDDVTKKELPVIVVLAILSGGSCAKARTKLISLGADRHLHSLEEMGVSGAKKALQRLASGNLLKSIFTRAWKDH